MKFPIFNISPSHVVGIDIQPGGIYIAHILRYQSQFRLKKTRFLPLAPAVFRQGQVPDWDQLTKALFNGVEEEGLKGAAIVAALPSSQVRLYRIAKEGMSHQDVVYRYIEQQFPGVKDTLTIDYTFLANDPSSLLIAAAKRAYLEQYTACLHDAGLMPSVMDIDIFALERAINPGHSAILWQQRQTFTLIWQNEKALLQSLQWSSVSYDALVMDLHTHLTKCPYNNLLFCGSEYYLKRLQLVTTLPVTFHCYTLPFKVLEKNIADYMLAIGLAMREIPPW